MIFAKRIKLLNPMKFLKRSMNTDHGFGMMKKGIGLVAII
jgi:hypothetical protein